MIDIRRMNAEIRILQERFGLEGVFWDPEYRWVLVNHFPLPKGFSQTTTQIGTIIPDSYGYGARPGYVFMPGDLKAWNSSNGQLQEVPCGLAISRILKPTNKTRISPGDFSALAYQVLTDVNKTFADTWSP